MTKKRCPECVHKYGVAKSKSKNKPLEPHICKKCGEKFLSNRRTTCEKCSFCKGCGKRLRLESKNEYCEECSLKHDEKVIKICTVCQEPFDTTKKDRKSCEKCCEKIYQTKKRKKQEKGQTSFIRVCKNCNKDFETTKSKKKTCNPCQYKLSTEKRRSKIKKVKVFCKKCNKEIIDKIKTQKYCDECKKCKGCKAAIMGTNTTGYCKKCLTIAEHARSEKTYVKMCYVCKKNVEVKAVKHNGNRFYCEECKIEKRVCEKCGSDFFKKRKTNQKYCKKCSTCEKCGGPVKLLSEGVCRKCILNYPKDFDNNLIIQDYVNESPLKKISKKFKIPFSYVFNVIQEFRKMNENYELLHCKICEKEGKIHEAKNLSPHLRTIHKINNNEYKIQFPGEQVVVKQIREKMSRTAKRARSKSNYNYRPINFCEDYIRNTFENLFFVGGRFAGKKSVVVKTLKQKRKPDFAVIKDKEYIMKLKGLHPSVIQDTIAKDYISGKIEIKKIVEFFGFYWHSQVFDGRTREQYEIDRIKEYKDVGIDCLAIWNDIFKVKESKKQQVFEELKKKIDDFLN